MNLSHIPSAKGDKYSARHCTVCLKNNIRRETGFICAAIHGTTPSKSTEGNVKYFIFSYPEICKILFFPLDFA
jgi:hypothetical protein